MTVLVTGAAGFIGSALVMRLLDRGDTVIGLDNHNTYYEPSLKEARIARHLAHPRYTHLRVDLADAAAVERIFAEYEPRRVVNLAAQAGVRYSVEHPLAYIETNLVGFAHVLEGCRRHRVAHLVYASSSSVYGANTQRPSSVHSNVDHPLSLYAATKKANELMAHAYSHLYDLSTTGVRFFTVYGPWMRPDMALLKFAHAIVADQPIQIFNHGRHRRDFTYIDDVIEGVVRILDRPAQPNPEWLGDQPDAGSSTAPWRVYNIGNTNSVDLMTYVEMLESCLGKVAVKEYLPLQAGDIADTCADIQDLVNDFDYRPTTSVAEGVSRFVDWYREYYGVGH